MSLRSKLENMKVDEILYTTQKAKQVTAVISRENKQSRWLLRQYTTEVCWVISVVTFEKRDKLTRVVRLNDRKVRKES